MLDNFTIKKAESADIEIVKAIETECGLSSWTLADYRLELERTDSLFFTCKVHSEMAGFILARLITNKHVAALENEAEIYNIAVKKEFRHRKIGSLLLAKLVEKVIEEGAAKIYLEVRKSNLEALNFYQTNDFGIIGERRNFYISPMEDAILMCRILNG